MKSLKEIQNAIQPGDYEIVGKALKISPETVRKKFKQQRTDSDRQIQKALSMLIVHREEGQKIIIKRIQRTLQKKQLA